MTDTPFVAGPPYGLRTWVVVGAPGEERLAFVKPTGEAGTVRGGQVFVVITPPA